MWKISNLWKNRKKTGDWWGLPTTLCTLQQRSLLKDNLEFLKQDNLKTETKSISLPAKITEPSFCLNI